jgi:hypothetical protein
LIDMKGYESRYRALTNPDNSFAGWAGRHADSWTMYHQAYLIKYMLMAHGLRPTQAEEVMGGLIAKSWKVVCRPFQDEYPGDRQWNRNAPQLAYRPIPAGQKPHHPHWDLVLNRLGGDLNEAVAAEVWAIEAEVRSGGDYLRAWIASLLRDPFEQLPYLFLFGGENTGKSLLHEAIALLVTKGVVPADRALTNQSDFNGELANAILCVVEEKNISKSPGAHAKIKDWVTAKTLSIRKMRTDSYTQPNTTHWIQCANNRSACPVFSGDTRITVIYVPDLAPEDEIPKPILLGLLREEAPHFLRTLLDMRLPEPQGRLRVPVVSNNSKQRAQEDTVSDYGRSVADYVQEHGSWHGTVNKLAQQLGPGNWPSGQTARKQLEDSTIYLASRDIEVSFSGQRTRDGFPVTLNYVGRSEETQDTATDG